MALISAAGRTATNLPTATAGPGVFAGATSGKFWIREVGVYNTTTTAVCVGLAACTATGTQAGALTEYQTDDPSAPVPSETAFTSQSTASTVAAQVRQASLGAAIGSGMVWTFGEKEWEVPEGTANGIIINCPTGTAQHLDFYIKWQK
jgi:hypothetical protein